jgi:hypothetical protein
LHDSLVWFDSVCINQDNEQEKKSQVAKKAEIYSMAVRVCVWLGAGDKQSDQARR